MSDAAKDLLLHAGLSRQLSASDAARAELHALMALGIAAAIIAGRR